MGQSKWSTTAILPFGKIPAVRLKRSSPTMGARSPARHDLVVTAATSEVGQAGPRAAERAKDKWVELSNLAFAREQNAGRFDPR